MSPTPHSSPEGGSLLPDDDPWVSYVRITVEVRRSPRDLVVVGAAPAGEAASWPWSGAGPLHVMTAWDPADERPGMEVNRRRQAALDLELRTLAATTPVSTWAASGFDPATGYRDEGVAVSGMSEEAARALAARYGQEAIFSWTPRQWAIVACTGGRRVAFGWTLEIRAPNPPS